MRLAAKARCRVRQLEPIARVRPDKLTVLAYGRPPCLKLAVLPLELAVLTDEPQRIHLGTVL